MTSTDVTTQKQQLRREMRAMRERDHNIFVDRNIAHRLTRLTAWQQAQTILIYVSFGSEIDTHALIKTALAANKTVTVPLCEKDHRLSPRVITRFPEDLHPGTMGILEPDPEKAAVCPAADIDLIVVPGLAFTKAGTRLGYGGGYYDRFLSKIAPTVPTVALVPESQILTDLPTDEYDFPVTMLISERGVYPCADADHDVHAKQ